jgi:hypothetical protein
MPRQTLIPDTLAGFDSYIRGSVIYLLVLEGGAGTERYKRLGMTDPEMDTATDWRDQWWTGDPANPGAYELHSNDNTKNKTTRGEVEDIMEGFSPFFSNLLRRMSTLEYTVADKNQLNIPERDAVPTERAAMDKAPSVDMRVMEGGNIKVRVQTETDATRPSMHPDADAIEVRYKIGEPEPAIAKDCAEISTSTKAMFTLSLGDGQAGKTIYAFVRYINISEPAKSSPYTTVIKKTLL